MEIERYTINPKYQTTKKGYLINWGGHGCDLDGCHCSDGHWVSMSDGKHGVLLKFKDKREMTAVLCKSMREPQRPRTHKKGRR